MGEQLNEGNMSGHSKWSTIKRKKAINDKQRSGVFSKMSRLISISVKEGGGITDPDKNFRLRLALERAKSSNMPKDTIERAIEKASGEGDTLTEIVYEGFGPGGSSLLILATSDNTNRTFADVKGLMERNGGKMGSQNSVAYMFEKCGIALFDKTKSSEQDVFVFSELVGAIDIEDEEEQYVVYLPFEAVGKVRDVPETSKPEQLDVFYRPTTTVELHDNDHEKLAKLSEKLEDLDDVQNVYTNAV